VVRASVAEQGVAAIRMAEQDWVTVFGQELVTTPRSGFVADRPVIGRHSRPQKEKWPDTPEAILSAYPDDPRYRVEILGGADIPGQILGRIPQAWSVTPFGAEAPADFLQRIDFWVYAHHPKWREAFGRAIMEALAAGCLVVLPGYLREIFGNAALYAEPYEVRDLVDQYWQDREGFLEQTRRGQQFAIDHGPGRHVERLRWRGVTP
jgi:glycosyltransferase involved in cell wall biosynthesis